MVLKSRAYNHFDYFDYDLPPHLHTSALLRCMRFPVARIGKPQPVTTHHPGFDHEEWERFDLQSFAAIKSEVRVQEHWWNNMCMSDKIYYHGAPFGAVLGMLAAGGFIPGPGKCRKNTRSVSGCFCSEDWGEAFSKTMGDRKSTRLNSSHT